MQKYGRYILNKVHLLGGAILPSCVEHVSPPGLCTDVPSLYHVPLHFTTSSVLSYCWNHRSDDDHCASDQASVLSLTLIRVEIRALHGNARSAHPKPAEVKGKTNQPLNHGLHGPGGLLALPLCREALAGFNRRAAPISLPRMSAPLWSSRPGRCFLLQRPGRRVQALLLRHVGQALHFFLQSLSCSFQVFSCAAHLRSSKQKEILMR